MMDFLFAETLGDVKSSGETVLSAVLPLLKLLTLTIIGLVLAHRKTQIIPKDTFKLLSKLVFALFLPCTIFVHLGESISFKNFALWWFIPVNVLISTAIGCALGYLVSRICKPPPEFVRFTVIVTAFGNTGNLPLAIVGSVCHSADNPFGPDCHRTGVAYVSFAQWVAVLLVYTLVYHMMEPPLEYYEVVEEGVENTEIVEELPAVNISRPLLVEAEWPGIEEKETENCKTPFIARIFTSISNISQSSLPDPDLLEEGDRTRSTKSIRCLAEPRMVRRIRIVAEQTPVRHILQPPTIATLFAFMVGMIPPLKSFVFKEDAPLSFVLDSLEILAGAMVPSVMLILGGMLAEGPNDSKLGIRTTVGIIIARLLVLPLAGIGVVWFADSMGLLIPGDQMYRFVLLLQYTTPSAILFGAIASLRGYAVSEASALLFWQHVFALFSISMYIILYFKLLLSYV
ncbi:protein PIN-LIKES 2-like [Rhododendron vialii]|uniref:protein PIN-LIKES 2-like n=1 Tax=Rhododendron vialii TaxID=182163 RepID=UPI00265E0036|nr:protein PIN-LIKES 2-like [Rhododendron vialii]XP_058185327.1 protein PIN-LIKES 2-like [Rhododendron vialii]XP_058185328.1 protein PIN-LIKES 2-like [Rhododendron vialii]